MEPEGLQCDETGLHGHLAKPTLYLLLVPQMGLSPRTTCRIEASEVLLIGTRSKESACTHTHMCVHNGPIAQHNTA
jgi:hypothetical protein